MRGQTDTCLRLVKSRDPQGKGGNSRRAANTPCKQSCHVTDRKNRSDKEERGVKAARSERAGWVAWFQALDPDT